MPSLTRYQPPAEGWNQNRQRGLGLFYDQHRTPAFPDGRPWWCYTERPADGAHMPMPVGELIPHGWGAPWVPENQYMQMSMGTLQTNRFRIMYERMITDYRQAMDDFYQRAAAEALQANLPIPEYGEALGWKLRAIVGMPPRSPRIPEAALAGDRWLLGFSTEPNEYLERLLTTGDVRIGRAEEIPIEDIINKTIISGVTKKGKAPLKPLPDVRIPDEIQV
jgi:hypothetical protein